MVPPTSIWTGAVKRDAAATQGIPPIDLCELCRKFPGTEIAGDTELLIGCVVGVEMDADPKFCWGGGDSEDELDRAVGEILGDVLILIWTFGVGVVVEIEVGKYRVDVKSRGSIDLVRSRSISHFRLQDREKYC